MKIDNKFRWMLLLIGGAVFLFFSAKWNVPVMAWIWLFCMLLFIRTEKKIRSLIITCLIMMALGAVKWYGSAGGSTIEEIGAGIALGFISCISLIVDYIFYEKTGGFKATLIFPLVFAVEEFVMQLTPAATVGSISATQTGNDPLIQTAALFGSYGISFIVAWFTSVLMYILENYKREPGKAKKAGIVYLVILLTLFLYGGLRLAFSDYSAPNVKVALSTGPYVGDFTSGDDVTLSLDENIASMQESVKTATAGKADILLFCEEAFTVADHDETAIVEAASQAARDNNIFVLIALEIEDEDNSQNGMSDNDEYLIDNHGEVV